MKVYALIGKTGTGKSYRSMKVARDNKIEYIIDDGLLIGDNRILAGKSAKHESTRIASVKRAVFISQRHAKDVSDVLQNRNAKSVLIIGTSDKMVSQISERLGLGKVDEFIRIEDVASDEEIKTALYNRNTFGQHVIPAPTFEVKKQFSGYFLNPLTLVFNRRDNVSDRFEKTIVRPTYSYLGDYKIAPKVIADICAFEAKKLPDVSNVFKVKSIPVANGYLDIDIDVELHYSASIPETAKKIQKTISYAIEFSTSIIVRNVNVNIKSLAIQK